MIQMGFDQKRCERAWNTFGNEEEAVAWLCENIDDAPPVIKSTKRRPAKRVKKN
jgi:uncharacterized UBP type Zn finger protein